MPILPIRCGNSNRADLQQISTSLLAQRGDAITTEVGSIIWMETQAWARAIYHIWAYNQKAANQFDPNKMTDLLPRWESMMGLSALPTDTVAKRQARIAARFRLINKMPTTQDLTDLLVSALGITFLEIINIDRSHAYAQYPGGTPIVGGITNTVNAPWYSTIQHIFIEVIHPTSITDNQFYATVNQITPLLNPLLPAYDTFDWFWDGFSDDGYASFDGYVGLVSGTVGTTTLTGNGTAWKVPVNFADNTFNIVAGSILEFYDDVGVWQRVTVQSVNSNTSITLAEPLVSTVTSHAYVIQGFFLDCDNSHFPYPPVNAHNLDNSGINSV